MRGPSFVRKLAMRVLFVGLAAGGFAGALAWASGCRSVENAAARDPMACERNPVCAKGRGSYADCSRQCNDDPACMDRCRQAESDRLGKP